MLRVFRHAVQGHRDRRLRNFFEKSPLDVRLNTPSYLGVIGDALGKSLRKERGASYHLLDNLAYSPHVRFLTDCENIARFPLKFGSSPHASYVHYSPKICTLSSSSLGAGDFST